MSSLSIKIPLTYDPSDGFTTIKNFNDLAKQHLKMLILTNPGERIMEPTYGVGAKRYLFDNFEMETMVILREKIFEQARRYIPSVKILDVDIVEENRESNSIKLSVRYAIPIIGISDFVSITI